MFFAVRLFGKPCWDTWFAVNLRDLDRLPLLSALENADLEGQLRRTLSEYRTNRAALVSRAVPFALVEASELIDQGNFSTNQPLRMCAYCMRADLDGFSNIVRASFQRGEEAVEAVARGFVKILEFGDYFERKHYGVVRLPWAGDCVSFLIPPAGDIQAFRGKGWITFVEEWQSFAANTPDGRKHQWATTFKNVAWSIGMTYANEGCCLVVTTGGTGPAPRDVTPEATLAVAHKVLPGFGEQMRQVSLKYVPMAILSRQVGVVRGGALILNLPGQPKAIRETLDGVFPAVPYCIDLIGGPYVETREEVCKAFRPKSALRAK
jgi:molybdopterin biosynthesis enzyme MoaB